MSARRVAIVGAGAAGLGCARALVRAGVAVRVFDKGRAVGGRLATRRVDGSSLQFDHGAQFFTARDVRFSEEIEALRTAGVVAPWNGPFGTLAKGGVVGPDPRPSARRFVGVPGMSALPRALAEGLNVHTSSRVVRVMREKRGYRLAVRAHGDERAEEVGPFDELVLALPPPQAAQLLQDAGLAASEFGEVVRALDGALQPSLCAMVAFDRPVPEAVGGTFVDDEVLSWVAHDGGKPGRDGGATFVLHGTASWSRTHFDAAPDAWTHRMLAALAALLGRELPPVRHRAGHRWAFALAVHGGAPAAGKFVRDERLGLSCAGDWLGGGRVEGAYVSGLELAHALTS